MQAYKPLVSIIHSQILVERNCSLLQMINWTILLTGKKYYLWTKTGDSLGFGAPIKVHVFVVVCSISSVQTPESQSCQKSLSKNNSLMVCSWDQCYKHGNWARPQEKEKKKKTSKRQQTRHGKEAQRATEISYRIHSFKWKEAIAILFCVSFFLQKKTLEAHKQPPGALYMPPIKASAEQPRQHFLVLAEHGFHSDQQRRISRWMQNEKTNPHIKKVRTSALENLKQLSSAFFSDSWNVIKALKHEQNELFKSMCIT